MLIKSANQEQTEWVDNQIVAFNKGCVAFIQDPTPLFKNYIIEDQGKVIVFGTLEDCPPGHQRFYLKKRLNSTEGA